jgi:hypothetical protein
MEEGMTEYSRKGKTEGGRETLEGDIENPWEGN